MLSRRSLLRGLIATPAVVAFSSLMPLKGVKFDPLIRLQSWPFAQTSLGQVVWPGGVPSGEWWAHTGRASLSLSLSLSTEIEAEMRWQFGNCYWEMVSERSEITSNWAIEDYVRSSAALKATDNHAAANRLWVGPLVEERSQFGYVPPQERNKYGHKINFRPHELQPVDLSAVHHIQDDHPQIPTEKLKAELARICQWGA